MVGVTNVASFQFSSAESKELDKIIARKKIGTRGRIFNKSSVANSDSSKPLWSFRLIKQRLRDFAGINSVFKRARLESERAFGQAALGHLIQHEGIEVATSPERVANAVANHLGLGGIQQQDSKHIWKAYANSRQAKKCISHADFMFTHPDQFSGTTRGLIKVSRTLSNFGDMILIRYRGTAKMLRAAISGDQSRQNLARGPAMYLAVWGLNTVSSLIFGTIGALAGSAILGATAGVLWGVGGLCLQAAQLRHVVSTWGGLDENQRNFVIEMGKRSAIEQLTSAAKLANYLDSQKVDDSAFGISQEVATVYVERKANEYERTLTGQIKRLSDSDNLRDRHIPKKIHLKTARDLVTKNMGSNEPQTAHSVLITLVSNYSDGVGNIDLSLADGRAENLQQPLPQKNITEKHLEKASKYAVLGLKHALDFISGSTANTLHKSASYQVGTLTSPSAWAKANGEPAAPDYIKPCDGTNDHYAMANADKLAFKIRQKVVYRVAYAIAGLAGTDLSKSANACKYDAGALLFNNGKPVPEYVGIKRKLHQAARYLSTNANEAAGRDDLKKKFADPRIGTFAHVMRNPHQYGRVSRSLQRVVKAVTDLCETVLPTSISQTGRAINKMIFANLSNNSSRVLGSRYGCALAMASFMALSVVVPVFVFSEGLGLAIKLSGSTLGATMGPVVFACAMLLVASSKFDYLGDLAKPEARKYGGAA